MGTKNNPGAFDCYANAAPDEPMFVLLGRDPLAGYLVNLWALLRHRMGEDDAKIAEALACAEAMDEWAFSLGKLPLKTPMSELLNHIFTVVTKGLEEHPDDYGGLCSCDACLAYDD